MFYWQPSNSPNYLPVPKENRNVSSFKVTLCNELFLCPQLLNCVDNASLSSVLLRAGQPGVCTAFKIYGAPCTYDRQCRYNVCEQGTCRDCRDSKFCACNLATHTCNPVDLQAGPGKYFR